MSKVVLAPSPTFELIVTASLLGGGKLEFPVTYKYRTAEEYEKYFDPASQVERGGRPDREIVMDLAEDWGLDAPFTNEGIEQACNRMPGLGAYIVKAYAQEYLRVRLGN